MKILLVSLMIALLAACSSTPTAINYYLLDGAITYSDNTPKPKSEGIVLLKKLDLAAYLQNANLPLLQYDHQVRYANHSAWAEPVQQGIKRALISDFNHLSTHQLVLDTMPNSDKSDYQLQIALDHFSATDAGDVLLVGNYWLSKDGDVLTKQGFNFKQTLENDGFNQSVLQQRLLLKQLATMIVAEPALNNGQ